MRRRLDLAASQIGHLSVIFLDEPTTRLDPARRDDVWRIVRDLAAGGSSVLRTAQYLEEADVLADVISVFARGRVIAHGNPAELTTFVGSRSIVDRVARAADRGASRASASAGLRVVIRGPPGNGLRAPCESGRSDAFGAMVALTVAGSAATVMSIVTWIRACLAPSRPTDAHRRATTSWIAGHRRQFVAVLGVVVALLVTVNVLDHVGPARGSLALGPIVAVVLLTLARRAGMSWHDLGLGRRTLLRGSIVGAGSVVAVVVVYAVGIALPLTRSAFLDARYQLPLSRALFTVLVVIPLSTVFVEEIAFRGVLQGLLTRRRSARWGLGVSSGLFGLWHILPSLDLAHVNAAIGRLFGTGPGGQVAAVGLAVGFTAVAGLLLGELRRRSGSLVASAGLHWAVNGVGVLFTALLFSASRA